MAYHYFGCKKCTSNAVQYVSEAGVRADEACMCLPGFYASGAVTKCSETNYKGNPDGEPPVPDEFTCSPCPSGAGFNEHCLGSILLSRDDVKLANEDEYYREDLTHPSGYVRVNATELGVPKTKRRHAPKLFCKVYGQAAPTAEQISKGIPNICNCPGNTYIQYNTTRVEMLSDIVGYIPDGNIRFVWNYDILPAARGSDINPSDPNMYFGLCQCLPGYRREVSTYFGYFMACVKCGKNKYCIDGRSYDCDSDWSTGNLETASKPEDCNKCAKCSAGNYCNNADPSKFNRPNQVRISACSVLSISCFC